MSKIYDALLKAQRKQHETEREAVPTEPAIQSDTSVEEAESKRTVVTLNTWPETASRIGTTKQKGHDGRVCRRVSVASLLAEPNSLAAEQFRKLRSVITTHGLANGLRTLLITSCAPEEGKTTVALNLASAIAHGLDDAVILVDADLRRSNLTNLLGLGHFPGLHDVLKERRSIDETLVATEIDGLTVIPGGINPRNPAELVVSNRMRGLIQTLKESYKDSYVLIDSTPIGLTSEPIVLSEMVDGVVFVILAGRTSRDMIKKELKSIDREKILGMVLNRAEFESSRYYGKHYKQYYSREED